MANKVVRQTQFTYGEADISVWKRTDIKEYLTAAQSLQNMIVGTQALCRKRPGSTFLMNATDYVESDSKGYEFRDQFGDYYLIIATSGFFYIFSTPNTQDQVIVANGDFVITEQGYDVVAFSNNITFQDNVPMPYNGGDLGDLDYTTTNTSLVFTHPNYAPGRLYNSNMVRGASPVFVFEYLNIYPLPSYDFSNINYDGFTVLLSVTGNVLTFEFTGLSENPGFTSAWVGGQIIGGGTAVEQPLGYAIITNVSYSGGTTTFTATIQLPFQTSGYSTAGSQYLITQPIWIPPASPWPAINPVTEGYPQAISFFQNRLWFGNTMLLPTTIMGSKINQPFSFDIGVGSDTDAIIYSIGQNGTGPILWINSGKQLEIFTQNNEFACPQNENGALTASTFSIRNQSSYGSSQYLKPTTYINDSYFVTRAGKAFVNFRFNGIGLTYVSSNISIASMHLMKNPINRALIRGSDTGQDNFIYLLNPDSTLTAFQFVNEYKLAAFTPVVFEGPVEIIDIVTIDNIIYFIKYYNLTEQYTIEFLDESTRMDGSLTVAMPSNGIITGLSLFNDYDVEVFYQNQDLGQYTVNNGQINVNNPLGINDNVQVGLLYEVILLPMYPFAGANASALNKQVTRIYVDYYESINFSINNELVAYQQFPLINGKPLTPQTDTAIIGNFTGWNRFGTRDANGNPIPVISITQFSPFDLQITGIAYQIDVKVI